MEWTSSRSVWLKAVLGVVFSGWTVYLCYTCFDWTEVWLQIRGVPAGVLTLAVACYLSGFFVRAWRASLMLETISVTTMRSSLTIVTIGYAGNNLFPFRMGELMRVDAAARIYGIRKGVAIVQVGAERILDAMAIVALLLLGLLFVRIEGEGSATIFNLAKLASVGFGLGVIGLVFFIRHSKTIKRELNGRGRIAEWIRERLIDALSSLGKGKRLTGVIIGSLLIWVLEAGSFSVLAAYWGMEDYLVVGWFVMGVVNLSVLLPSAPGHIGIYHWAVVLALGALSVSGSNAMGFAVVIHALQWLSITAVGLLFMFCMISRNNTNEPTAPIRE